MRAVTIAEFAATPALVEIPAPEPGPEPEGRRSPVALAFLGTPSWQVPTLSNAAPERLRMHSAPTSTLALVEV